MRLQSDIRQGDHHLKARLGLGDPFPVNSHHDCWWEASVALRADASRGRVAGFLQRSVLHPEGPCRAWNDLASQVTHLIPATLCWPHRWALI